MTEALATITSKGQVTIPISIRQSLGLRAGDKVAFSVADREVRLRKTGSVVAATAGILARRQPPRSVEVLREAAEEAIAEEVGERSS